jgi:hypothetical protein
MLREGMNSGAASSGAHLKESQRTRVIHPLAGIIVVVGVGLLCCGMRYPGFLGSFLSCVLFVWFWIFCVIEGLTLERPSGNVPH